MSSIEPLSESTQSEDSVNLSQAAITPASPSAWRTTHQVTEDMPVTQACIDASKLHLMFSCDEKLIQVSGAAEGGRAMNRAPVFMMTWLAGEWQEQVDINLPPS